MMVGRWPEFSYDFSGARLASLWPVGERKGKEISQLSGSSFLLLYVSAVSTCVLELLSAYAD